MDIISISRNESGSSLFLYIKDKSGLLFKATHDFYGQSSRDNLAGHWPWYNILCDMYFFFFITGSYSSRRGCFVRLTQKDTTICVQTYSELCKLIKKKKPFVNECCVWNASFVPRSRKTEWSTEIFFWNPKLSFWNVWKLTWLYFFVEKAADSPYTVHDRMVYVFIHQNTALVYCVKSLGYVFLWRYVIVFMLLLHKELFTVFEFNFSMIPDVLLSKCVLINCQIYKSEMYHVYEL